MRYIHNKTLVSAAKNLRKNMTPEEKHLWYDYLRTYPIRFQRQKILGNYIADFYCAKAALVLELDGSQHYTEEAMDKDEVRSQFLENEGLRVLRILNRDINEHFAEVCQHIDAVVKERC